MDSHESLEHDRPHGLGLPVDATTSQSRSNSLDGFNAGLGQSNGGGGNIDLNSVGRPTANLDALAIAYQDHFGFWTHAAPLFKHLTRFDLKLARNPKLESLNGQFNAPRAEELRVAVRCHYVPLEAVNAAAPGHAAKRAQHAPKESGKKGAGSEKPHASLDSAQPPHKPKHRSFFKPHEHRSAGTPSSSASSSTLTPSSAVGGAAAGRAGAKPPDPFGLKTQQPLSQLAELPYVYLFLVPPSTISEYKKSVKPRLKEFITRRVENKLNEEFLIVCFTWATKKDAGSSPAAGSPEDAGADSASPESGMGELSAAEASVDDTGDSANAAQLIYPISSDHLSIAGIELSNAGAPAPSLDPTAVPKAPLEAESITKDLLVSVSISKEPLQAEIPTKHPLVDESFYRDPSVVDPLAADSPDSDSASSLTTSSLATSSLASSSLLSATSLAAAKDPLTIGALYGPNATDPTIRHNPSFTSRLSFSSRHSFTSRPSFTNESIYGEALAGGPLDSDGPESGLSSPKRAFSLSRLSSNNLAEVLKRHEFISKGDPQAQGPAPPKSRFNLRKLGFGKLAVLAKPVAGLARPKTPREGEDRRVVERIRLALFKHKLRSRLVVVPLDPSLVPGNENADQTGSRFKNTDALLINAIRDSGINKTLSSLINLSVNKRYLYMLIHVNKLFLPFITTTRTSGPAPTAAALVVGRAAAAARTSQGTASATPQRVSLEGAPAGTSVGTSTEPVNGLRSESSQAQPGSSADGLSPDRQASLAGGRLGAPGPSPTSAVAASVHSVLGSSTVGGYLEFVDALECLANLFFKLHLVLESVFLYEFLLHNANFARLLCLFRATTVERSFFSRYNALISYCGRYYSSLRTNLFSSEHQLNVERFCYVRYRLYILSKQLLMLSSGGHAGAVEAVERAETFANRASAVDRPSLMHRASGGLPGVSTLSPTAGAGAAGSGDNALLLSVLLIYNFMNDAYFQVLGSPSLGGSAASGAGNADLTRVKWLILVALELVRHIENRLNAEGPEEEAPESPLGELVERKRKKFSFFKSLFAHHGGRSGARGASGAVGTSASGLLELVGSYYGLKRLENAFKYVSFVYLVLYKLVLQLHQAIGGSSGGATDSIATDANPSVKDSTHATVTTDPENQRERMEAEFDAYVESLNHNCLRLHYSCAEGSELFSAPAPTTSKAPGKPNSARSGPIAGVVGSGGNAGTYDRWKTIDSLLERVVDHRVAIIERCSKYFILSNMQRHSSVIRSYYLGRVRSLSRLETPEAASVASVTELDKAGATQPGARRAFSSLGVAQSLDSPRTIATELTTDRTGTRVVPSDRATAAIDTTTRLTADTADRAPTTYETRTHTDAPERGARLARLSSNHPLGSAHPDAPGGAEAGERVVCSLVRCNEYDHLYSKSYRASNASSLSLYPHCHNYVHVCLANAAGSALDHVRLFLSTTVSPAGSDMVDGIDNTTTTNNTPNTATGSANLVNSAINTTNNTPNNTNNPAGPPTAPGLEIDLYELTLINVDNRIVNLAVFGCLDPSARLGSALQPSGIKLPSFSNKLVLCVPIKLCGLPESPSPDLTEIRLNVSVTATTTTTSAAANVADPGTDPATTTTTNAATDNTTTAANPTDPSTSIKTSKTYSVRVREIFEVRLSEAKGVKSVYLRVQYRDLVKIHQIYLNSHIIAGTTLLDYNSIYKIVYQPGQSVTSTTTNTPTNRDPSSEAAKGADATDGAVEAPLAPEATHSAADHPPEAQEDVIRIYYSLYRKHRSSLQQVTHNQLYLIRPSCLAGADADSPSANAGEEPSSRRSQPPSDPRAPPPDAEEPCAQLVMKVPGYAFVSKAITLSLWLLSDTTLTFSYSIDGNQSWFIEGLVVNNNVVLTKGKRYGLQFRLIPLREGRLEVPPVRFRGLRVDVPRREVTVFPTNYLLL